MIEEIELTVKLDEDYDTVFNKISNKGYKHTDNYTLIDIYMIPNNIDININEYEVLKKCILLRNQSGRLMIVYKDKKYDNKGNILSSKKIECDVKSLEVAEELLKAIGYKKLFTIKNVQTEFRYKDIIIRIQHVNDRDLYLEVEASNNANDKEKKINELKMTIDNLNLKMGNNYFEKKALVELQRLNG